MRFDSFSIPAVRLSRDGCAGGPSWCGGEVDIMIFFRGYLCAVRKHDLSGFGFNG